MAKSFKCQATGRGSFDRRLPNYQVIANPKAKLLDQVREVMRLRHDSIRTEQSYCDWIERYVTTTMIYTHVLRHGGSGMKSPLDLL